jgi:hypothetical protein
VVAVASMFQQQLNACVKHFFRVRHQFRAIRQAKENLREGDAIIHIDFSENYSEKVASEVQAAHFGTRRQIVLHQGMLYLKVCSLK